MPYLPIILVFLSFHEIHYALLAVAAFADGLGRGVHDCVARTVATMVVDYAAGLEVRIDRDRAEILEASPPQFRADAL